MALEKVTLARVSHFKNDKNGNPLTSKTGKPYTRCLIDTTDGRKLSGFGNQTTSNWNEGMEVEIEITESNGYLNFNTPKGGGAALTEMAIKTHIDQKFAALEMKLFATLADIGGKLGLEEKKDTVGNTDIEYPQGWENDNF